MIRIDRHDDVVQLEMFNRRSRTAGYSVNAFLVRGTLIDCGFPGVGSDVGAFLDRTRLHGVIVTHFHEDHAGNIEAVAQRGIPFAAHPETVASLRAPAPLAMYRRFTWGAGAPLVSPHLPFDPDGLAMIHTPGHSPDHHVVWDESSRTLFSGDLFIGVRVRVAHRYEQPRALVGSLRRVLALEPRRVFDAHRGLLRAPMDALRAKVDWTEAMIARVESLARDGMPPGRICRAVLGGRDMNDLVSAGEYSRANLVRAVLAESA